MVPRGDVIKEQYETTTFKNITCSERNNNIVFLQNEQPLNIVTPILTVQQAFINQGEHHNIQVNTDNDFFKQLDTLVQQAMLYAFESPTLFEEATDQAWERVNMDMEQPQLQAFKNFMHGAKTPDWKLAKKSKYYQTYVTIVDKNTIEHTGRFTVHPGATVQICIRLFPYHINAKYYGVSASIHHGGIMVHHYGGPTVPRTSWNKCHFYIDNDKVKDARGHDFVIALTPTKRVENNAYFHGNVKEIEETVRNHLQVNDFTTNAVERGVDSFSIKLEPRERYLLTPVLYKTERFGGLIWTIYTKPIEEI